MNHYARPGSRRQVGPAAEPVGDPRSWNLARKLSFGATPELVAEISAAGPEAWLEQQLAWEAIPLPARVTDTLASFRTTGLVGPQRAEADQRYQMPMEQQLIALVHAIWSPRHVHEVLVELWNDHLNVSFLNREMDLTIKAYDEQVARRHATGRFADLLLASARTPAMMEYLDNHRSRWPEPNENYARELMELHTVGVDGGYAEEDVVQAARALTGWSRSSLREDDHYFGFVYDEQHHYTQGPITVLGLTMPAMSGPESIRHGEELLAHLAAHPATARHLSTKLARRFTSMTPDPGLVDALTATWLASDGRIADVMRTLVGHPAFEASAGQRVVRPFNALAAMLRTLGPALSFDLTGGAESPAGANLTRHLEGLGQQPFYWNAPDGFPDDDGYWAATSGLLARWNTALKLCRDKINGIVLHPGVLRELLGPGSVDDLVTALVSRVLGRTPTPTERAAITSLTELPGAATSAELDDDTLRAMTAMALSLPAAHRR